MVKNCTRVAAALRRILRGAGGLRRGQRLDHRGQQRRRAAPGPAAPRRAPRRAPPAAHRGRRHRHGRPCRRRSRTVQRVTVISPRLKGAPSPPWRPRAMTSPVSGPRSRRCGGRGGAASSRRGDLGRARPGQDAHPAAPCGARRGARSSACLLPGSCGPIYKGLDKWMSSQISSEACATAGCAHV